MTQSNAGGFLRDDSTGALVISGGVGGGGSIDRTPIKIADTTAAWANSDPANTEKIVAITGTPATDVPGRLLVVFVRNPSTETTLTVQPRLTWTDPNGATTRFADLSTPAGRSTLSVLSANGDGQVFLVDGGVLAAGGRLSLKNDTVIGAAGAFTASIQIHAVIA